MAAGGTPAKAIAVVIGGEIKSIRMIYGGSGYTTEPVVSFSTPGNGARATAILDSKVLSITVTNGGTGYTIAPDVVIDKSVGSGAYAIATILNGAVSNIKVISGGTGYKTIPPITFTGGAQGAGGIQAVATAVTITEVSSVNVTNGGRGYYSDTTNQEKLLLKIINKFVTTGRDGNSSKNSTIKLIEGDIKTAAENFVDTYIKKIIDNTEAVNRFCNKITQYKFNINRLDKLYGKDKNEKRKFVNIIAYVYNIMYLVLYNNDASSINTAVKIKESITTLITNYTYKNIDKGKHNKINDAIIKVFTSACINCFKVNFRLFDNYMKKHMYPGDIMCILNVNNILTEKYFNAEYFKECQFIEGSLDKSVDPPVYVIPYYNNLTFYDHGLLSEYSENTKYIIQILIIFGIGLAIITFICLVYSLLIKFANEKYGLPNRFKLIVQLNNFINYVFIFYNKIMYNWVIQLICYIYYIFFCMFSKSNYTFLNLICNISNILLIMFLIGYSFAQILELLNIDYVGILSNLNFSGDGKPIIHENAYDIFNKFIICALYLYFVATYLYCAYLVRYGLNESQFDILSNPDADQIISMEYLNNITLSLYANNILSNINAVYTDEELDKIAKDEEIIKQFDDLIKEVEKEEAAKASVASAAAGGAGVAGVAGVAGIENAAGSVNVMGSSFGNGNGDLGNALGDLQKDGNGKIDLNGALGDLQKDGKQVDLSNFQGKNGDGKIDLSSLQSKDGKQVDVNAAFKNFDPNNFSFGK